MVTAPVDLVVNTWERSYRDVLQPGFFHGIEQQCRRAFSSKIALINNVEDVGAARQRADRLVAAGELSDFHLVAAKLPGALQVTGIAPTDIEPVLHYCDAPLVAVTLPGAPWLVYWDADVRLLEPTDWIGPAVELMDREPRILAANPDNVHHSALPSAVEMRGGFALGFGFSDQLFMVRRSDLARPIYGERCVASLRYPLVARAWTFEARVDAHMRHRGWLRATHLGSRYVHPPETAGLSHPADSVRQFLRHKRNMAAVAYLRHAPPRLRPRCARDLGEGL